LHEPARCGTRGNRLKRVAVVGAGTMGHGIAQVAATAGYQTCITDTQTTALDSAVERIGQNLEGGVERGKISRESADRALGLIDTCPTLEHAVQEAHVVIEAVVENIDVKRDLFRTLDSLTGPATVLATNTSSLSVGAIASATKHPARVVGMHFFNPVHIMKLVEIVVHDGTDQNTINVASILTRDMGKEPIRVRDTPGFASSRLGVVLALEAMRMVEQDVATPHDIDKAMELGYGHPMGPLKVTDLVGLDVRLAIAEYLHSELGAAHYQPPEILRQMVEAGELGKKTGKGFYDWQ
jgi:3-hydroxybutyryl-CoA dehydrogenase